MRRPLSGRLMVALCAALLCAGALAEDLVEVPHPILDEYKPDVRAMLAGALGRFELMAMQTEGPELGVAYGRLGVHYYAHAEQDAARACFINAAQLDPNNHRWPYYLAVHYAETGAFEQAAEQFRRVLALEPDDAPALVRLGQALVELGRVDEAAPYFERALRQRPRSAAALAGLARVAEEAGDYELAVERYEAALEAQPEASQLHYRLGQAYRRLGNVDKAREHLEQRGPRIPSIDDPLLMFMNAHIKPAAFYVLMGNQSVASGDAERAWRLYDLAYAIDPTATGAMTGMARLSLLSGNKAEAERYVEAALKMAPGAPIALQLRGLLAELDGNADAAVDYFQQSLERYDDPQTRIFLANTLMQQQRYAEAAAHYDAVAAQEGAGAEVRYRAALAHIAAGDCAAAEPLLLAAYEAQPGEPLIVQALARIYATCIEANQQQLDAALRYAEALYGGYPGLETSETLAMTMAAHERYQDAVDFQAQAIFEALKAGTIDSQPHLQENMERYKAGQRASEPWPAGHAVFSTRRAQSGESE